MRALFAEERPDGVIHLAAESHVDRSIDAPAAFIRDQRRRHVHAAAGEPSLLARAAARSARTRSASSTSRPTRSSARSAAPGAFTEETPYAPRSPYAASKAAADHLVRAWYHTYGLPTITTNCSNNYGPYQFPEKLIPLAIQRALHGQPIPVYGRGENVRDWLYVDDHARALLAVFERGVPGETYNIGGHGERRNLEIVEAVCALLDELAPHPSIADRRSLITFVADRPGHDLRYAIDMSKIERELGWTRARVARLRASARPSRGISRIRRGASACRPATLPR